MSDKERKLDQAFARLAATEDGKIVLNWIMNECDYYTHSTCMTRDDDVSTLATVIMSTKRSLWLNTRVRIPIADRIKIEYREHLVIPEDEPTDKEDAECQTKTPKTRRQKLQEQEAQQLEEPMPEMEHRQRRRPPSTPTGV